jgi:fatty acid desaturase
MGATLDSSLTVDARRSGQAPSDYAVLKQRVREAGLLDKQPWFYVRSIIFKLTLLAASLAVFVLFRRQPWVLAADAVALAIIFGQLGFQLHDAGHRQMFEKGRLNTVVGLLTGNLLLGMSYGWWVDKHNRHHANPNDVDADPDIGPGVISYSEEQALASRGVLRLVARYQAFLFFPLLFLLGWIMHANSSRFLLGRGSKYRRLEVGLLALHVLLYVGFFFYWLGPWWALMAIGISQCCGGFYLASVFAPNHKGMPQVEAGSEPDFLRRQVLTSRNVRAHPLTDVWYGGLNYQIEHHLFPTMARNRVARAHDIVRKFCEERGIPYHQTSMLQSYREILSFLHQVGAPLRQPPPKRAVVRAVERADDR